MKISVIVPVLNEEETIGSLIDALCAQSRKPDEIVITDGGSTDKTTDIIKDRQGRDVPVRLLIEQQALPGRGRNVAAACAEHEWLAFVDAGIRPAVDWLEHLEARAISEPAVDVVYGSWNPVIDTFFRECAAIAYVPPPAPLNGIIIRPRSIASSLMRATVWRSVGGFPEHLRSAEDLLFMQRIEEAEFATGYAPLASVNWNIQGSIGGTFRRFSVYSRNNLRAGLWRYWQRTICIRYLVLFLTVVAAIFAGPLWLVLPALLFAGSLVARSAIAIHRNRMVYPAGTVRNLGRIVVLCFILVILDAAAIRGVITWLIRDWPGSSTTVAGARNGA